MSGALLSEHQAEAATTTAATAAAGSCHDAPAYGADERAKRHEWRVERRGQGDAGAGQQRAPAGGHQQRDAELGREAWRRSESGGSRCCQEGISV